MHNEIIRSLADTLALKYEFISNLYKHSKSLQGIEYASRDDKRLTLTRDLMAGELYIRPRTLATERERQENLRSVQSVITVFKDLQSPLMGDLDFVYPIFTAIFDWLNLEELKLPPLKEMKTKLEEGQRQKFMEQAREPIIKVLNAMVNKGNKNIAHKFIRDTGMDQFFGLTIPESEKASPPRGRKQ